jgi:hypothetical protein
MPAFAAPDELVVVPTPIPSPVRRSRRLSRLMPAGHVTSQKASQLQNNLDTLPPEVFNHILSYIVHPSSRAPGLTEAQSHHSVSNLTKMAIKDHEDRTMPTSIDAWSSDIFTLSFTPHPFNSLALTSRRCHDLVENYCGHLVRICNPFNLPFAQFDAHGSRSVYPDLSRIVYRRLWLQHAPRYCVHCAVVLDQYPFPKLKRLIASCRKCFDRHILVRTSNQHISSPHH